MELLILRRARPRARLGRCVAALAIGWLGLPAAPAAQPAGAVVIPFTNISRQSADAWIGVGIAETVSSDLRNLGVPVIGGRAAGGGGRGGRAGCRATRRRSTPAACSAARWLVAGGYQRVGDLLRITARLVDVTTGEVRRSTRVDGPLEELFDAQDRIVAALMDGLAADRRPAADVAVAGSFSESATGRVESGSRPAALGNPVRHAAGVGSIGARRLPPQGSPAGGTGVTGMLDLAEETDDAVPGNGNGNGDGSGGAPVATRNARPPPRPRRGGSLPPPSRASA